MLNENRFLDTFRGHNIRPSAIFTAFCCVPLSQVSHSGFLPQGMLIESGVVSVPYIGIRISIALSPYMKF